MGEFQGLNGLHRPSSVWLTERSRKGKLYPDICHKNIKCARQGALSLQGQRLWLHLLFRSASSTLRVADRTFPERQIVSRHLSQKYQVREAGGIVIAGPEVVASSALPICIVHPTCG